MSKADMIELEGVVKEALPNTNFLVDIGKGHTILATISGKLRMNYIRMSSPKMVMGRGLRSTVFPFRAS